MCGIAGYISTKPTDNYIHSMCQTIGHRGPDDHGYWNEKNCFLGQTRLSIIDLSEAGHQPMFSANERYVIVFNGEIYNYQELKKTYIPKDYYFKSNSDTEVILALFSEKGYDTPKFLNGIFAFAIFDRIKNELFIARDHFGVKPLYYVSTPEIFAFSSEIKAILTIPSIQKEINKQALHELLTFRHVPSPNTLFNNICKLEPGHFLIINDTVKSKKQCYWDYIPKINYSGSESYFTGELQHLYFEATKRQMISDAPIGLSLSGGVDSSALLAIMSEISTKPVKTFTVGFEDGGASNEIEDARQTAKIFGAEFYPYMIKSADYLEFFQKYIWHLEEPMGNESAAAYYFVAKEASKHVKVLLNGQGIDETMAGYHRYLAAKYTAVYQAIPNPLKKIFFYSLRNILSRNEQIKRSYFALNERNETYRFGKIYSILPFEERNLLYNKNFSLELNQTIPFYFEENLKKLAELNDLEKMLYIDARTSLSDNLLLCEDKMSMASSVEARVPFLDVPLVEFIETIPGNIKLKGFTRKYIHKKAVAKWLPKGKIYQKKKGFDIPMDLWLKKQLKPFFNELINDKYSITNIYLNPSEVKKMYMLHCTEKADYTRILFLLLSIEMWNKTFVLNEK